MLCFTILVTLFPCYMSAFKHSNVQIKASSWTDLIVVMIKWAYRSKRVIFYLPKRGIYISEDTQSRHRELGSETPQLVRVAQSTCEERVWMKKPSRSLWNWACRYLERTKKRMKVGRRHGGEKRTTRKILVVSSFVVGAGFYIKKKFQSFSQSPNSKTRMGINIHIPLFQKHTRSFRYKSTTGTKTKVYTVDLKGVHGYNDDSSPRTFHCF